MARTNWVAAIPLGLALVCSATGFGDDRPIGDAWSDSRNPVRSRFKGQRLDHWSLKVPLRAHPPVVQGMAHVRNAIDQFMLARLDTKGLSPSPEADRKTLIRRLTFGLTGLPPTTEEVQGFLDDQQPDAYERLVDRLLSSRQYGERWARHWLDVVRYADSNGFERDEFRPTAWRYRDYVIKSFNDDKPYNQFLREQLAGDEMAGDRNDAQAEEQRIATGFLRLGPFDTTKETNLDNPIRQRDELLTDLVNTTASGFLGLTFTCCKCHDHKYDPFLQADHYRLRAYFAAVEFADYSVTNSSQARTQIEERIAEFAKELAPRQQAMNALIEGPSQRIRLRREVRIRAIVKLFVKSGVVTDRDALRQAVDKLQKDAQHVDPDLAAAGFKGKDKKTYETLKNEIGQLRARKDLWKALGIKENVAKVPPTKVLKSGDYRRPAEDVQPGIPSLFVPGPASTSAKGKTTGRRSALADWIASRQNPWTARVMVNRIWQQHFGKGLVATPDDFGHSGSPPSNPALLDWLAVEFMETGWSIKHIQRLIVTSAAYRQTSADDPKKRAIDPENALLWRQNIQRLDAETLRDALLAVSGRMLPTAAGPPAWPEVPPEVIRANPNIDEETDRLQGYYTESGDRTDVRSIFLVRKRSVPSPFLQAFNQPDPACTCGRRDASIVAPQALMLLNNPFSVRIAQGLAERLQKECGTDTRKQLERAFRLALARPAVEEEAEVVLRELARLRRVHAEQKDADQAALADVCSAILNTNEFIYVD
jgi:hypothetical protein